MPNPGETSAGFIIGRISDFTSNPRTNISALPSDLRQYVQPVANAPTAVNTGSSSVSNQIPAAEGITKVPQSSLPGNSVPAQVAQAIQESNAPAGLEAIGFGDNASRISGQVSKFAPPPPQPKIIGYTSGITETGTRYQTPIYDTVSVKGTVDNLKPNPSEALAGFGNVDQAKVDAFNNQQLGIGLNNLSYQQQVQKYNNTQLGNALISLSNKQALDNYEKQVQQYNNAQLGNALISLSNTESQAKSNAQLQDIVSKGLIGNATQFDIYNAQNNKVGSIPANKNALGSLQALASIGEPFSVSAVNTNAQKASQTKSLSDLSSLEDFINKAKQSGATSIDVLGPSIISGPLTAKGGPLESSGVKIGTTTPDRALYDVLSYQKKGIPVSLSYTPQPTKQTGILADITNRIESNPISSGFITGASVPGEQYPSPVPFTGGISTPTTIMNPISSLSTGIFQPPTSQGGFLAPNLLQKNPQYIAGGLAGLGLSATLSLGLPGVSKGVGVVSDLLKAKEAEPIISKIASAFSEGRLPQSVEKVSPQVGIVTQGTEGRSIVPSENILPSIIGINEKGIPTLTKIPNEVKIPSLETAGEAQKPLTIIETAKGGATSIVKPVTNLPANKVLLLNIEPELAANLGLKEGSIPNSFTGEVTPSLAKILTGAEEQNKISSLADIFKFPTEEVKANPKVASYFAENPKELVGTTKFPEITRPEITRVYQGQNIGFESPTGTTLGPIVPESFLSGKSVGELTGSRGLNRVLSNLGLPTLEEINPRGPSSSSSTTGGTGKTNLLTEETKSIAKNYLVPPEVSTEKIGALEIVKPTANIFTQQTQTEKANQDYLSGLTERQQRTKKNQLEETEIVAYPPGTKLELIQKTGLLQVPKLENDILQQSKRNKIQGFDTISKLANELSQRQNERNQLVNLNFLGQNISQQNKQRLSTNIEQVFGRQAKQTHEQNQSYNLLTSLLNEPLQTTKPSILQSTKLIEQPIQIQTPQLENIPPVQINPPNYPPTTNTFLFPSGGGFGPGLQSPDKNPRRKYKISFAAYSVNPNIVGAIAQAGVPGLSVSSRSSVFGQVNLQLERASKKIGLGVGIGSLGNVLGSPKRTKKGRGIKL